MGNTKTDFLVALLISQPTLSNGYSRGILFDVLESIIQRDFGYATLDIRQAYSALITILNDANIHKVVLILHSQGAIEGGLALDWLYATVSADQLSKLEIYTFANAANHWNAPSSTVSSNTGPSEHGGNQSEAQGRTVQMESAQPRQPSSDRDSAVRAVRHIEHYANISDYVSRTGILHFRPDPDPRPGANTGQLDSNRFVGRLFKRNASGHLLNQHYLNYFFRVDSTDLATGRVVEDNDYMNSLVDMSVFERWGTVQVPGVEEARTNGTRIKDLSRLWMYRNGGNPGDPDAGEE